MLVQINTKNKFTIPLKWFLDFFILQIKLRVYFTLPWRNGVIIRGGASIVRQRMHNAERLSHITHEWQFDW